MKKICFGLLWLLLLLVLLAGSAFVALYTPYATPLVNKILQYAPFDVQARSVRYAYPAHFTFDHAQIAQGASTVNVDQLQVWVSVDGLLNQQLRFDSILLDGLDLNTDQLGQLSQSMYQVNTGQLAVKNLKLTGDHWRAHELSIQVRKPQWQSREQLLPYGNVQISAGLWKFNDETLSDVLIDAEYRPADSTIYGASFHWRDAMISGQAEQYGQQWSLVNATINHLNMAEQESVPELLGLWSKYTKHLFHINSLDILSSSFNVQGYQFNNADVSIEDVDLNHSLYQQTNAALSFNAESINHDELQLIEPNGKFKFADHSLQVEDFAAEVAQGNLQLSATLTPDALVFHQFNASDVKILEHSQAYAASIGRWLQDFASVKFERLDIKRAQIIQTEQPPYWQLSGVNALGSQISVVEDHRLGLWDGQAQVSANNLSYDQIISTQPIVEFSALQGRWQLSRLSIPLENGYLDATASGDLKPISQPWQISMEGDGVPIRSFARYFSTPITLQGVADFSANLEGLAGDKSMLTHSLSGEVTLSVRDGQIQANPETQQPARSEFAVSNLKLTADRGRITLQAPTMTNVSVQGKLDLVTRRPDLTVTINDQCGKFQSDLLSQVIEARSKACPALVNEPPAPPSNQTPPAAEDAQTETEAIRD